MKLKGWYITHNHDVMDIHEIARVFINGVVIFGGIGITVAGIAYLIEVL